MKSDQPQKSKEEIAFTSAWVVTVLLILPSLPLGKYGGGIAMFAGSLLGSVIYYYRYMRGQPERFKAAVKIASISCVAGAAIALAMALYFRH